MNNKEKKNLKKSTKLFGCHSARSLPNIILCPTKKKLFSISLYIQTIRSLTSLLPTRHILATSSSSWIQINRTKSIRRSLARCSIVFLFLFRLGWYFSCASPACHLPVGSCYVAEFVGWFHSLCQRQQSPSVFHFVVVFYLKISYSSCSCLYVLIFLYLDNVFFSFLKAICTVFFQLFLYCCRCT